MMTNLTGSRTSTNKTSDIRGRAILGRHGHNLNKLGEVSEELFKIWVNGSGRDVV